MILIEVGWMDNIQLLNVLLVPGMEYSFSLHSLLIICSLYVLQRL